MFPMRNFLKTAYYVFTYISSALLTFLGIYSKIELNSMFKKCDMFEAKILTDFQAGFSSILCLDTYVAERLHDS